MPVPTDPNAPAYAGTVWYQRTGTALWAVFVEAEPHMSLGALHVYVRTRAVVDGVRWRTHKSIMTLDALLSRYTQGTDADWPGTLPVVQ